VIIPARRRDLGEILSKGDGKEHYRQYFSQDTINIATQSNKHTIDIHHTNNTAKTHQGQHSHKEIHYKCIFIDHKKKGRGYMMEGVVTSSPRIGEPRDVMPF
jgi:hypothetical protein